MLMDIQKSVKPVPTRAELLSRVFGVLDREKISWCVLHGYESWPQQIGSESCVPAVTRLVPYRACLRRECDVMQALATHTGLNRSAQKGDP